MTKYNLTTILFILFAWHGMATEATTINRFEEPQYTIKKESPHIIVPVNFGEAVLLSKAQLKTLDMNSIYQIDLVYTKFKRSAEFDQTALNEDRLSQLRVAAPEIERDAPAWNFISQTKAKDFQTAENYFHGFVIYYRPEGPDYTELKEKFRPYRSNIEETYLIDNTTGGSYEYPSGTQIHVPANAAVYANGEVVQGQYEINYTEYRTPADIALSGIPMTYEDNGENLNFSSVGMYEITGSQNKEAIKLQKAISIDFNTTEIVDDAAFYQLNETNGAWEKIRPIGENEFGGFEEQAVPLLDSTSEIAEVGVISWSVKVKRDMVVTVNQSPEFKEDYELILNKKAWLRFSKLKKTGKIESLYQRTDDEKLTIYTKIADLNQLIGSIGKGRFVKKNKKNFLRIRGKGMFFMNKLEQYTWINNGNVANENMQAYVIDKGHTYPKMVQGLKTSGFGIYNCDQVYRIPNKQTIHPVFVDAETGDAIENQGVACLLDLNKNGSFSFNPQYITYNPKGRNALLLTVGEDQFYLIQPEEFQKIDQADKNPVLNMTNVTAQLNNTADLKKLLGL